MSYVLRNTKTNKFVARWGTSPAYTTDLERAQVFESRKEAEQNRRPEAEVVLDRDTLAEAR